MCDCWWAWELPSGFSQQIQGGDWDLLCGDSSKGLKCVSGYYWVGTQDGAWIHDIALLLTHVQKREGQVPAIAATFSQHAELCLYDIWECTSTGGVPIQRRGWNLSQSPEAMWLQKESGLKSKLCPRGCINLVELRHLWLCKLNACGTSKRFYWCSCGWGRSGVSSDQCLGWFHGFHSESRCVTIAGASDWLQRICVVSLCAQHEGHLG